MQKSRKTIAYVLLLIFVIYCGASVLGYLADGSVETGEKVFVLVAAFAIIGLCIAIFGRSFKRQEKQLAVVRQKSQAAYHCTMEMSGKLFIVALEQDDLVLYLPKKDLPEFARVPRRSVTMRQAEMTVSAGRTVNGIEVTANDTGKVALRLILCKDKITPVNMPPMTEPELTQALNALGVSA